MYSASYCSNYKLFENYLTENVIFLLSLPWNFLFLLVLDAPEVPGSPKGSRLRFLAAEPLFSSCLSTTEPENIM